MQYNMLVKNLIEIEVCDKKNWILKTGAIVLVLDIECTSVVLQYFFLEITFLHGNVTEHDVIKQFGKKF